MKHLYVIIFFILIVQNSAAQQTVDNEKAHRRYWYYRTRLINDFMKIGKAQGNCIVLAQRNTGEDASTTPERQSTTGPDQIDITNQYIMALALEYKLLTRNYQDASETIKELYHLLYTINRLDLEAEQFWDTNEPNSDHIQANGPLNGFMLREDTPKDYFNANNNQNILDYNYSLLENGYSSSTTTFPTTYGGFTGTNYTDMLSTDNFYSDHFSPGNAPKHKMSLPHDKYHSMLIAMMFIDKYIPSGVDYNGESFQDGYINIKDEAREISKRVYNYLKGVNNNWHLRYLNSQGVSQGNMSNPVGGDAWIYSFALGRMTCHVNSDFPWSTYFVTGCSNYSDPNTNALGYAEYSLQAGSPAASNDNAVFKGWDQAGANCAAQIGGQPIPVPIYTIMQNNTSIWHIEWTELLRKVLHQKGSLFRQLSIYGDPINEAPCTGPYNYGACNHGGWEWSSQDRLEHPDSRGNSCNNSRGAFQGNYPGVDYMLLHNLYYEYQNQLFDGNQGNVGIDPVGNIGTWIFNAANNVSNTVISAGCSIINAVSGLFGGSTSVCDPSNVSGNGGAGSNTSNLVGYYAYNYMDNKDENVWPRKIYSAGPLANVPNNIQGINQAGLEGKVAVFQNLSSTAHIYAGWSPAAPQNTTPSNVTYRAGKEIVLLPGFQVDQGSTYRAYIQRYICNGNNDALYMRKVKDSILMENPYEFDYESDKINPIPIHYVESPKSDSDNNPVVSDQENISDMTPLDHSKTSEFSLSPNPTTGRVIIQTKKSSDDEKFSIHVYDMKGQLVYIYENVTSDFEINIEGHSKGIYMVQLISSLGNSITKKIDVIE